MRGGGKIEGILKQWLVVVLAAVAGVAFSSMFLIT